MAPIALYPDPLISLVLPASAFPTDIAAAGAYLNGGGDPGQVDTQPWDPSVRSLSHYPDVVKWMAGNEPWTQAAGAAFVSEPAEVMKAIQRLRELARAAGTLADSPQQQVIVEGSFVEIEPAQPDVIYVPVYNPEVVFVDQPYYGYGGPFFTYGPAYPAGLWLTFGCNWHGGGVIVVDAGYWHGNGGWWHPYGPVRGEFVASVNFRPWGFPEGRPRPQAPSGWQTRAQVIHPQIAGAPRQPPQSAYRNIHTRGPAAVAVVARNPAAFKGKPLNSAIIPKSAGSPAPRAGTPARPQTARPQSVAKPQPKPTAAVARPAPAPLSREETEQRTEAVKTPATAAPEANAEQRKPETEAKPANAEKNEKVVPKPKPKPKPKAEPKEEERKPEEPPH
jgi:hypothetical protein